MPTSRRCARGSRRSRASPSRRRPRGWRCASPLPSSRGSEVTPMTCRGCHDERATPRPGEISRRRLLELGGATLLLLSARPGEVLAASAPAVPSAPATPPPGVLVVFFQRGAADGLHMVPAYRDARYRALRGTLALPEPGRGEDRPRDLGDGFALHPSFTA